MNEKSLEELELILNKKRNERVELEKELELLKTQKFTTNQILENDEQLKDIYNQLNLIEKKSIEINFKRLPLPNEIGKDYLFLFDSLRNLEKPFIVVNSNIINDESIQSESEQSESSELIIKTMNSFIPPTNRVPIRLGKAEKEKKEFETQLIEFDQSPELDRNFDQLRTQMKFKKYRCFYNSSIDGLFASKINGSLRKVKNAMFVITSTNGFVFGAFSSSFQSPDHTYGERNCDGFVFTLINPIHSEPLFCFNSNDKMVTIPLLKRQGEIFSVPDFVWITKQKCWIEVDDFYALFSLPPLCDNHSLGEIFTPLNNRNEFSVDSIYGLEWFD